MICQCLMSQAIDGLTILASLDDVPTGVSQNPLHVVVIVGSTALRQCAGD
jgi:hypothetical protein